MDNCSSGGDMVSPDLLDFVEKRWEDFQPDDLDALEVFLDKEKYLGEVAREKLFHHFELEFYEDVVEEFEPIEVAEGLDYGKTPWDFTGQEQGKIATKTTWKYVHELYDKNDSQWVMLRDRKSGQFRKRDA